MVARFGRYALALSWGSICVSYVTNSPVGLGTRGQLSSPLLSYRNAGFVVAVVDWIVIIAASIAAGSGYHLLAFGHAGDLQGFTGIGVNAAFVFVSLAKSQGMYRLSALLWSRSVRRVVLVWMIVMVAIASVLFLLKLGES